MKRTIQRIGLTLVVPFMLVACGDSAPTTESAAAAPTSDEPVYGGNLVIGVPGEPVIINDLYLQDVPSSDIVELVFASLMTTNVALEMIPQVAVDQPTVSDDGLVWTYTLHDNVRFHDGEPLTAHDVAFTYSIFKHPDYTGPRSGDFLTMESVVALDNQTVQFTLTEPDARFATRMTYGILPQHILGDIAVADLGDYTAFNVEKPIGAGPFKFVSWNQGQNIVLEANEDYFEGRPYLDRVTFRFAADLNALVLLMERGEIHHFEGVPAGEMAGLAAVPHVNMHSTLALRYDFLGYNLRNPLFQDKRVRQALTHAIDRQEIVDTVMEGHAEVAHAPVSPLSWAYNDDVPRFDYDPERALELMAEAGWTRGSDGFLQKDGQRFSFEILSNDGNNVRRDLGIIVQQMLGEIGIEVNPRQMEWGAFLERILSPNFDFDATILAWSLGLDPDPSAIWHTREIEQGLNNVGYSNPAVDAIADSNIVIVDQDERAAALAEAWALIAEDQPYTFMWYPQQFVALNERVNGFVHHPRTNMHGVERWWLSTN
ncbi:peptide-binding protein [Salinispirillum sp. LH 10-3-1]|uniref:Peptide-binding protein n=1 Tax=Salinispirillum sp. LH 10-3-1 TaxID=2952525 RepID=A0AB38YGR3_9GAMM